MRSHIRPGTKVKISHSMGCDAGKTGTVVSRQHVKTNSRGVPTEVAGAYKPVNWSRESVVRLDNGELVTVFSQCLMKV